MTATPTPPRAPIDAPFTGSAIGLDTDRIEGALKVTGGATYVAEFAPAGLLHAVLVTSSIAAGRVTAIDHAPALELPGVVGVFDHTNLAELPGEGAPKFLVGDWRDPLGGPEVEHVGQAVAVVVAETWEAARHGADVVAEGVEYEAHTVNRIDERDADAMFAVAAHAAGHAADEDHERGDVDAALAADGVTVVAQTYATASTNHAPMEPHATIAEWRDGDLVLHEQSQGAVHDRGVFAAAFALDPERVHVISPYIGGAFGGKGATWPHALVAAKVARHLGRPVKVVLTRAQMFTSVGYRPATQQRVRIGATADGALVGLAHDSVNVSARSTDWLESCCRSTSVTLYDCANVRTTQRIARANVHPPTFMRAPGETPGTFALESAMDELAIALGIDPLELRVRNHAETNPASGLPWSGRHLLACYASAAERFGWARRTHEVGSMRDGGVLVGWGMASCVFPGIRSPSSARVRVGRDGEVVVQSAGADLGTGAYTVGAIIAADLLGLRAEQVRVELGDSGLPKAALAGGSSLASSMGEAVAAATRIVIAKLVAAAALGGGGGTALAGCTVDDVDLTGGRIVVRDDPRRSMTLAEAVAASGEDCVEAQVDDVAMDPETTQAFARQTTGCHFVEVRIDPAHPRVQVSRVVSSIDIGRVLNPRAARSQVYGAIVMALGMTLMEDVERDPQTWGVSNANLADYAVPVHADVPDMDVEFIDIPDAHIGTLGVRGPGEVGTTGLAAAVANAVHHATGVRLRRVPITPDMLLDGVPDPR